MNINRFFIIIGVQRCGTTYLYQLLNEHPEISMASPHYPEPKYFLCPTGKGWTTEDYVAEYFSHRTTESVFGEKSVSYFENRDAVKRIKHCLPDVRIIAILRDPTMRALSHYQFSKENGLETRGAEEVFFELRDRDWDPIKQPCSMHPFNYLSRGLYTASINFYLKLFGRSNVKIIVLENIRQSKAELQGLYRFLGVDHEFTPVSWNQRINISSQNSVFDEKIVKKLRKYFEKPNASLANQYGLDLRCWEP